MGRDGREKRRNVTLSLLFFLPTTPYSTVERVHTGDKAVVK
jgi:hypothetical protein